MLHRRGLQFLTQGLVGGFTGGAVVTGYAHLDELVCAQRNIGFEHHGGGHAIVADHDNRVQWMGARFEGFAFGGSELEHEENLSAPMKARNMVNLLAF